MFSWGILQDKDPSWLIEILYWDLFQRHSSCCFLKPLRRGWALGLQKYCIFPLIPSLLDFIPEPIEGILLKRRSHWFQQGEFSLWLLYSFWERYLKSDWNDWICVGSATGDLKVTFLELIFWHIDFFTSEQGLLRGRSRCMAGSRQRKLRLLGIKRCSWSSVYRSYFLCFPKIHIWGACLRAEHHLLFAPKSLFWLFLLL